MSDTFDLIDYFFAVHEFIEDSHHDESDESHDKSVVAEDFGTLAEVVADGEEGECPNNGSGNNDGSIKEAVHFCETGGNGNEHLESGDQFSDREKPDALLLKYHLNFAYFFFAEYRKFGEIMHTFSSRDFVQNDVTDRISQSARKYDVREMQVPVENKISCDDI